jgi:gamma-glutamylcyclotransferase (GGCT)/AIG2-like uncharacterized protein YtfP
MLPPVCADDWVHGDLYDLGTGTTTLTDLDAYEQAESPMPAFFERELHEIVRGDATPIMAWVYWYRGEVAERQRIVSGRYQQNCDPEDP